MVWYVIHEYAIYDDPSQVQHTWKVVGRYESKGKAEKEALELSFNEYCKDKPMRIPRNLRNKAEYKLDDKITIVTNVMCNIQESSSAMNKYRGVGYFIINSDDLKINRNVINISDIFKHLRNYSKEEAEEAEGEHDEHEGENKVEGEVEEAEGEQEVEGEHKQEEVCKAPEVDEGEADKGGEEGEVAEEVDGRDEEEPKILETDYENERKQSLRYLSDELEIKKENQDDSEYETESYYETESESESESSSGSDSESDQEEADYKRKSKQNKKDDESDIE